MKKRLFKNRRTLILAALAILLIFTCAGIRLYRTLARDEATDGKLTLHFVDVGQGDATLLTFPDGRCALIDTGTAESADELIAYLRRWNIERIDCIFLSHLHSDHAGGLDALCEAFAVGTVCYTGDAPTLSNREGELPTLLQLRAGYITEIGGVSLRVLAPLDVHESENDNSMILRVEYGEISFLFAGDAESEEENDLLNTCPELLDADLLKVAHHGSANSTSEAFLEAVSPQVALISSSEDNSFGHPAPSVVERLKASGAGVYLTSEQGSVTFICDGETLTRQRGGDYLALPVDPARRKWAA